MPRFHRGVLRSCIVCMVGVCGMLGLLSAIHLPSGRASAQDLLRQVNAGAAIELQGVTFAPSTVQILVGEAVTWTNAGGFHNVEADDASFRSGDPTTDAFVFSHIFAVPGTYTYRCAVHGGLGMTGTVVVVDGALTPQLYLPQLSKAEGG